MAKYIYSEVAGGYVPIIDLRMMDAETEKKLAKEHPVIDPERLKELEEMRKEPINIPITYYKE